MPSKTVTDNQKSADAVAAAAETHSASVGEALSALCKPHLKKGEVMPDFALAMCLFARVLGAAKDRMVKADDAHEEELKDDAGFRRRRDDAATALYDEIVEQREILTGLYGVEVASKIIPGTTPRDPVVLVRYTQAALRALSDIKLPPARVKGAKIDRQEVIETLSAYQIELSDAIQAVAREMREAEATQEAKNDAIGQYQETFTGVASTVSGHLRLAGKPVLAAQVKPSRRRPGQTAAQAGEVTAESSEPQTP